MSVYAMQNEQGLQEVAADPPVEQTIDAVPLTATSASAYSFSGNGQGSTEIVGEDPSVTNVIDAVPLGGPTAASLWSVQHQQAPQAPPSPLGPAIAGAGLTYTIVKDALMNAGDVKWVLEKMDGVKNPYDDPSWANRGTWAAKEVPVDCWSENKLGDRIAASFVIKFRYNGHSIGDIGITNTGTNDAVGWALDVSASILPARDAYRLGGTQPAAAVEITFNYRFSRSIGNDSIYVERVVLYGTGDVAISGSWTQ